MALNPQIPLMGRGIDLGGAVAAGLQSYQGAQRNKLLEQQTAAEAELQPLRNRLLTAQTGVAEQKLSKAEAEFQLGDAAQDAMMIKPLMAQDPARAIAAMDARIEKIKARGGDPKDTIALRDGLVSGNVTPQQAIGEMDTVIGTAERFGLLGGTRNNAAVKIAPTQTGYEVIDPYTGQVVRSATNLKPSLDDKVNADIRAAGGKRAAEAAVDLKTKPAITTAVTTAKNEATTGAEAADELKRAQAALPGLRETVASLKELSKLATYTTTGKAFDLAAKELGFGGTKGSTARAKMVSVVDNQVLPLLRDTFGAAFTAAEGERLRDTLLDPDASPEAREAQLNAFMDQKERDIETKQRQLGIKPAAAEDDWSDL